MQEDETLRSHVMSIERMRKGSWKQVADVLNRWGTPPAQCAPGGMFTLCVARPRHPFRRSTKQCRERWINILDPSIKRTPWTEEEMAILFAAQAELGNKWAEISQRLPGRPETAVKNKYYAYARSKERQMTGERPGAASDASDSGEGTGGEDGRCRSLPPARARKQVRPVIARASGEASSESEGEEGEGEGEGEGEREGEVHLPKPPSAPLPTLASPLRSRPLKRPKSDEVLRGRPPMVSPQAARPPPVPPLLPRALAAPDPAPAPLPAAPASVPAAPLPTAPAAPPVQVPTRLRGLGAALPAIAPEPAISSALPTDRVLSPVHSEVSELSPAQTPGALFASFQVSPFVSGEGLASLDALAAALSGDLTNDPPTPRQAPLTLSLDDSLLLTESALDALQDALATSVGDAPM